MEVVLLIKLPFFFFLPFFENLIFLSIYCILQADAFAKKLGYTSSLRVALVKLQVTYCQFSFPITAL